MTRIIPYTLAIALLIILYGLLYYFAFSLEIQIDFASFYHSTQAYAQGANPYIIFSSHYLLPPQALPRNLNPPFFLELMQPLARLNYLNAALVWAVLSFVANSLGAWIVFKLTIADYLKKNWLVLFCSYFALYSTITMITSGQLAGFVLLFIISGYYFYQKKQDYLAGICWGIIISIKLFPGLLLLMVLSEKRYRVAFVILLTCLMALLIPLLSHGIAIYRLYVTMLPEVAWYGSNWNASFCGFIYRLLYPLGLNDMAIKAIVVIIITIALHWYSTQMSVYRNQTNHHLFCLTLIMMLLLSPFGWIYYFSLLLMPIIVILRIMVSGPSSLFAISTLLISLFLLNIPMTYVSTDHMAYGLIGRLSIYSCYFYGLLILAWLLTHPRTSPINTLCQNTSIAYLKNGGLAILAFGFLLPLTIRCLRMIMPYCV